MEIGLNRVELIYDRINNFINNFVIIIKVKT